MVPCPSHSLSPARLRITDLNPLCDQPVKEEHRAVFEELLKVTQLISGLSWATFPLWRVAYLHSLFSRGPSVNSVGRANNLYHLALRGRCSVSYEKHG